MNYESTENQEMQYMTQPICRQSVKEELSADYTLPDYRPEIRRLLYVGAVVLPPAKYVGGGRVELDGVVEYQILYVGADGELYSAPLTGEYGVALPLEGGAQIDFGEGVCVLSSARAESVTPRVTGPRRLTLRTRLVCEVSAYGKRPMAESVRGEAAPESICVMQKEASVAELSSFSSDEITLLDEVALPSADARVVSADGRVMMRPATRGEGEVTLEGDVLLSVLCAYPDGRVDTVDKKIPFASVQQTDALMGEGCELLTRGQVRELTVNVEEGKLLCEIRVTTDTRVMSNRPLAYRSDLFSTACPTEVTVGRYTLPVHLHSFGGNLTQSERLALAQVGLVEGTKIVTAFGTASLESGEEKDGGKYALTGQCRYVLICERDGEFSASEVSLPLRYVTERADGRVTAFDAVATVVACRAQVNGDTLELDAELSVGGSLMGEQTVCPVEEVSFGEAEPRPCGQMIFCFPAPGESLWEVAKRYRVSPARIVGNPESDRYVIV